MTWDADLEKLRVNLVVYESGQSMSFRGQLDDIDGCWMTSERIASSMRNVRCLISSQVSDVEDQVFRKVFLRPPERPS